MLLTRGWGQIFHAGTAMAEGQLVSTGGRVLGVTAMADDALKAQTLAYQAVDKVRPMRCTYVARTVHVRQASVFIHVCAYIHTYVHTYIHTFMGYRRFRRPPKLVARLISFVDCRSSDCFRCSTTVALWRP